MGTESKPAMWAEYLTTQKQDYLDRLQRVKSAPPEKLRYGPADSVLDELDRVFTFLAAPSAAERRDQLLSFGLDPRLIVNIDLSGSQKMFSFHVLNEISRNSPKSVLILTAALEKQAQEL